MRVIEHQFSDLLRRPKEVTSDVEDGDVLLRRRNEPDLRLTRADRVTERDATLIALGRTLRYLATHDRDALGEALRDAFPWLEFLTATDRRSFIAEFSRAVAAATELDSYGSLLQLVQEWRATAEVRADPQLARRLRRPIQAAGGPVVRPGK